MKNMVIGFGRNLSLQEAMQHFGQIERKKLWLCGFLKEKHKQRLALKLALAKHKFLDWKICTEKKNEKICINDRQFCLFAVK